MRKQLLSFTFIAVALAGCGANPGETGEGTPAILSTSPWIGGDQTAAGGSAADPESAKKPLDSFPYGGNGGTPDQMLCPTVAGAFGRAGQYVDQLGLTCAEGWTVGPWGGGGGTPYGPGTARDMTCPPGYFANGVQGRSGQYVDRFGIICRDVNTNGITLNAVGGNGGAPYIYECPGNQKMVGLNIRHGKYVDQIQVLCGAR